MGAQGDDERAQGYDRDALKREGPVRDVHIQEFQIGKYPVTVHEFKDFLADATSSDNKQYEPVDWHLQKKHPNRPVVLVSWHAASAYAAWVGNKCSFQCSLPSEAQWERAARGIGLHPRRYPWGDSHASPHHANIEPGVGHATGVTVYSAGATPERAYDMAGNVWEWCHDFWHDSYENAPANCEAWDEPPDPQQRRVIRGGSFCSLDVFRSANRNKQVEDEPHEAIGFRIARRVSR